MANSRKIVLGITGGIAAYKAAELTRRMVKEGWDVQVVMTQAAQGFITPATLQALSGNPVYTDMWDPRIADNMAHIELSRGADAIVVAPATADFIAKLAQGFADDLLSALCLARACPLMVAPAMNLQMWENAATRRNVAQLARDGVAILGPDEGEQACGETGLGRMLEPETIQREIMTRLQPQLLSGKRVLITAGPTYEAIDAVRGITNRSSGRMGYAVAQAALEAGAQVTLISGPTALVPPPAAQVEQVMGALDMLAAVQRHAGQTDIFISVAAVADYRVEHPDAHKIKKSTRELSLKLVPAPDILASVAAMPRPPFCVGFAAESEHLHKNADAKRRLKKLPLLAANTTQAIGSEDNELVLFDDAGTHVLARASKLAVARQLVAHIARLYDARKPRKGGAQAERAEGAGEGDAKHPPGRLH